jgi:hypothetical protein
MSDHDFSTTDTKSSPKKPISPARNIIGVVALIAVLAVGALQYAQKLGYNAAVTALNKQTQNEESAMMTVQETEQLLGKAPDGPGIDFRDGPYDRIKKTYTWSGLLKSYTVTAYYTKDRESRLVRYETEGAKQPPKPVAEAEHTGHSRSIPAQPAPLVPKPSVEIVDPKARTAPDPAKSENATPKPAGAASKPAPESKSAPAPAPSPAKDEN